MNGIFRLRLMQTLTVCIFFFLTGLSIAQPLTGVKTIPGDYATIAAAVTDLNLQGVGTGGVIFNVTGGHTESVTAPITINATGITGNTIVFQKSGAGLNPKITRTDGGSLATSALGAQGDAVIFLNGTDYITFDAIDIAASAQGVEYGYFTNKPDGANGCQNVSIRNSVVTMTKGTSAYVIAICISNGPTSLSSATGVTVSSVTGTNSNVLVVGCTVVNASTGILVRGGTAINDDNITFGQAGAGNIIQNFGASATSSGIYFLNAGNIQAAYNSITGSGSSILYGIYTSTAVDIKVDIFENNIQLANTSSSGTYGIYNSAGGTGTTNTINIYNNIIENFNITGTSTVYGAYNSATGFTVNMYGNIIRNNTKTAASGNVYWLYSGNTAASGFANIYNNQIYGNTYNGGTGDVYCLYTNEVATANKMVYDNLIYNNSGSDEVFGLYSSLGVGRLYKNTIYNLSSSTALTTSPFVSGIIISSGTDIIAYNNYISDLRAAASGGTDAVRGINITSTGASSTIGLYYNTIYLSGTSSAVNFGSTGIYHTNSTTATTAALDMRNNVVVNMTIPKGTGLAVAFRRSAANVNLNNYATTSNNNLLYAGTPGASNLIFNDGTNSDQTLPAFKGRVTPREALSVTENPPFLNVSTTPYNLHMNTAIPTQTESGGTPVTTPIAITTDYDGDTRHASAPDIGADEFAGIGVDLVPPTITYTPLGNTSTLTGVTLTASITDGSGVTTSGIGLPVLYWKINSGSYNAAQATYLSGSNYQFTFAAGSAGDTIRYYIAAQDMAPAQNVGVFPPAGASGFTSNPPAVSTPPTSPSSFLLIGLPMSGTYTIGLTDFASKTGKNIYFEKRTHMVMRDRNGKDALEDLNDGYDSKENPRPYDSSPRWVEVEETYYEMMENGRPFDRNFYLSPEAAGVYPTLTAAINDLLLRGLAGPVTFSLLDANYPNETYPITIGAVTGSSSTNTVTIKPAAGVTAAIPGDLLQSTATFWIASGTYVIVDGSNTVGGTTKDLKITGLRSGAYSAVYIEGTASNNIVKNVILESRNTSNTSGTLIFGAGATNNNTVENCTMKNVDTAVVHSATAVQFFSGNIGTGNQILNCNLVDFTDYGFRIQGGPNVNTLISGCDVHMTTPSSKTIVYGAYVSRADNLIIEKSKFYELLSSNPVTVMGIYLAGSSTSSSTIVRNNFISISGTTPLTAGTMRGIDYFGYASNSFEAYFNSIYINGSGVTGGESAGLTSRDTSTTYKAYNNAVHNARANGSGTGKHYAVYVSDQAPTFELDYNDYFADGTGGVLGYYRAVDILDIHDWHSIVLEDDHSISGIPGYSSGNDLHIITTYPTLNNIGTPISGITTDIDGETRNVSIPDIGADEYIFVAPTILDPTNVSASAINADQINIAFTPNASNNNVVIVFNLTGTFTAPSGTPPAPGNPFAGGTLIANTITSPFSHTGLVGNTTYFYKAFSYDGLNYSSGIGVNAITPCDPVTAFSENFDAGTALPDCWVKMTSGGTATVQATNPFSPPNALYFYGSSTAQCVVSLPPVSNAGAGTHWLKFFARGGTAVGGIIEVGYLTDPLDYTSFVLVNSITVSTLTYEFYNVSLGTAPGANQYLAIRHPGVPANGIRIDNVGWEQIPTCSQPLTLTASGITNNSASLGWTQSGSPVSWDIEYGPVPFSPTGIPTIAGVTNPYNLTGLTSNTEYAYYVRANCGGGDYSAWSGPLNFWTQCDPVTAFTQNFDGVATPTLPACWLKVGTTGTVSTSTTYFVSSPNSMSISSTDFTTVSLPPLSNAGANTYWLKLKARSSTAGAKLEFGYLTNPLDGSSFVLIGTHTLTTAFGDYILPAGTAPGSNKVLALRNLGDPAYTIYVDDVSWEAIPACAAPMFIGAAGITANSANLTWVQPGSPAMWDIEYGPTPFTPTGTPTISGITSNPYNLTGLNSATGYAYYVRANCGGGSYSTWSGPYTFTTECAIVNTFPWGPQIFDGTFPPSCYTRFTGLLADPSVLTTTTTGWVQDDWRNVTTPTNKAAKINIYGTTRRYWLVTPSIDLGAGTPDYQLEFDLALTDYSNSNPPEQTGPDDKFAVIISTDGGTTWSSANALRLWDNAGSPYVYNDINYLGEHIILNLSAYSGIVQIGFYGESTVTNADNDLFIDNLLIKVYSPNPIFTISPLSKNFGPVYTGTSSAYQKFTISNTGGGGTLTITTGNISITGTGAGQFALADSNAYPINLAVGQTAFVYVKFSPTTIGAKTADLQIVDNLTDAVHTAPLTGIGATPPAVPDFENFEAFIVGQQVACQDSINWTTWTYTPCDATLDAYISSTYAFSGTKSIKVVQNNDLVRPLARKTSGKWTMSFMQYIPAGKTGYFNTLAEFGGEGGTNVWGFECYFNAGGVGSLKAGSATATPFTWVADLWKKVEVVVDLDLDSAKVIYDGTVIKSWQWTLGSGGGGAPLWLDANDFYGSAATDEMYVDDYKIEQATNSFQLTVNVAGGWNMVSIPGLLPTNQNVITWWPGKDPAASVFKFQSGYQPVTVAAPGLGYWMKNLVTQTYNTGEEWPAGGINIVTHDPIPAFSGWNMIGGYEQTVNTINLTTTPPGLITGTIYKYTPGSGYQPAADLVPGYGYWIKLTANGSINVPSALAGPSKIAAGPSTEGFGKITIIDAAQKSYTLYAVNRESDLSAGVDLTQFDLPPYPPQGMFDVRYSSQRYAEKLSTSQTIEMTGVEYPVKIKAEEVSIIISDETGKEIARLKAGEEVSVTTSGKLMIAENVIPAVYSLEQNYPNPFNPSTTIQFSIPEDVQNVKLIVYSALGEKVAELVNTGLTAGIYKINWNASNIASGLYIYQVVTDKFVSTKKMMLLK